MRLRSAHDGPSCLYCSWGKGHNLHFQMRKRDSGASPLCMGGRLEVGLTLPLERSLGNEGQSLGWMSHELEERDA